MSKILLMQSPASLFLFTNSYPFVNASEGTFLEREIQILAEMFNVVCVPQIVGDDVYKKLPGSNFSVDYSLAKDFAFLSTGSRWERIRLLLFSGRFLRFFKKDVFLDIIKNYRYIGNFGYWERLVSAMMLREAGINWFKQNRHNLDSGNCVLYSYWLTPVIIGIAKEIKDIPVVSRAHGGDLYEERHNPPVEPLRPTGISGLTEIYPCSKDGSEYLLRKYPTLLGKVTESYLGTPDSGIGLSAGHQARSLYFVSCSFLGPIKQIDVIANGIRAFALKHPEVEVRWTHFGDGPMRDELTRMLGEIRDFRGELLPFPGIEGLRAFYRSNYVDAFINASKSEGLPVSIMEAASFGIPLIAPDVGGVREILLNKKNGFLLFESASVESVAGALEEFGKLSKDEIAGFRNESRRVWESNFDSEKNYLAFAKRLKGLIENRGVGRTA